MWARYRHTGEWEIDTPPATSYDSISLNSSMTKPPAILHPEAHKAAYLAHGVLCVLAGAAVAGVAWVLWQGVGRGQGQPVVSQAPPAYPGYAPTYGAPPSPTLMPPDYGALPTPPPAASPLPPAAPSSFSGLQQPPIPSPAALANQPPQPVLNTLPPLSGVPMAVPGVTSQGRSGEPEVPTPTVPPGREIRNPQAKESVIAAREVRRLQDMSAALNELRTADMREPNHPEILGEMALTYELMGIESKAQIYWKQVMAMGEAVAGGYYTLAKLKLEGGAPAGAAAEGSSPVTLGNCQLLRDPTVQKGERITVRVPIIGSRGATINPDQMVIHVLLYESVNNGAYIEQVRSGQPVQDWVSKPINWQDTPEETLDVTYDLPEPSPDQIRDLGKREFHGYIVKLFYRDRLVGEQIHPESLRGMSQRGGGPGLDDALFRR